MSLADQASLLLIPSGYKSQKVYSIFPTDGDGDFDFSRSGSATRIAKNGLITTVDSNIPRLEYPLIDGVVNGCPSLLLEPQRTNLIPYSEDFSDSSWSSPSSMTLTPNDSISPNGLINATKLNFTNPSSTNALSFNYTTIAVTYSSSIFVKYIDAQFIQLWFGSTGFGGGHVNFDLINGLKNEISGAIGDITDVGNGWFKISATKTSTGGSSSSLAIVTVSSLSSNRFGDEVDGSVYIWGAQLEQGSYPTSYIPTNGNIVTRNAETCNGAGDAAIFNDSEGVLMVEMNRFKQSGVTDYLSFGIFDSSGNNAVAFKFRNSLNVFYASIESTLGSPRTDLNYTFNDLSSSTKILVKYKTNDFALWVNGFKVVADSSGYVPTGLNQLKFSNFSNSEPFNGNTKQVQYYNSALTDSELEELTSWTSFTEMANGQQYSII